MNEDGTEYAWPEAGFIIGNPPFLGHQRMRSELGDDYVETLRELYGDRLPGASDFVCYWFEKARSEIITDMSTRAGLIATNSIRSGANRQVLDKIKDSGDIFLAWSDESWTLEGAAVRVSIVGFDGGDETVRRLDGQPVANINPDLTSGVDMSTAKPLTENSGLAYTGMTPIGPFDISKKTAHGWLELMNPTQVSNADVIRPFFQGRDLTQRPQGRWVVDFDQLPLEQAENYVVPFDHVETHVKPVREKNRRAWRREHWWLLGEPMPAVRQALEGHDRYIATSRVSKHRIFVWVDKRVLPGNKLALIADSSDYVFGVVSSSIHVMWSEALGSWHGVGNDSIYTPTTCFETFPFPRAEKVHKEAISTWARHLGEIRLQILGQDAGLSRTKLYNELEELREHRGSARRAYLLLVAHEKLDEAVASAYGWDDWPLDEDEILRRLLSLNLERAAEEDGKGAGKGAA